MCLEADLQVVYTQKSRKPKDIRYDKDSIRQRRLQLRQALEFLGLLGPSVERNWSISRTGRAGSTAKETVDGMGWMLWLPIDSSIMSQISG